MTEDVIFRCPKCGAEIEHLLGAAPATVTVLAAIIEGKLETWVGEDQPPEDIADLESIKWRCPECEAEFHELENDQDLENFIKENRIQPELPKNNPHSDVGLPSMFEGGKQ